MERRRVIIENIYIGSRHREPDMAKVREIAKSISETCLMNPPAVVFRDGIIVDGEEGDNVPVLIYGRHRLLALQELGETSVECIVHDVDDLHAELMEIDENLARAELSPAQEAAHILRRQELWRRINSKDSEETGRNSPSLGGRGNKDFASEVAAIVGNGRNPDSVKRDVNLKIARAREIGPDIHRIAGTSLDKGVEMDALIKLPPDTRAELIERAAAGEKVSARPTPAPKPMTADRALDIMAADIIASHKPASIASPLIETIRAAEEDAVSGARTALDEFLGRFACLTADQRRECLAGRDLAEVFDAYTK